MVSGVRGARPVRTAEDTVRLVDYAGLAVFALWIAVLVVLPQ